MNCLEQKIIEYAAQAEQKIAIQGESIEFDYNQLLIEIERTRSILLSHHNTTTALLLENHPAWAILDLALLFNHQCCIALPDFFSIRQIIHALNDSKVESIILEGSDKNQQLLSELGNGIVRMEKLLIAQKELLRVYLDKKIYGSNDTPLEAGNHQTPAKITYTSGTTDQPKGVILSERAILTKVTALARACEITSNDVSLSILPLSTLLENIGGLYVPLYCGASCTIVSPGKMGISGSSGIETRTLLKAIEQYSPSAFIIIPQLLRLFIQVLQSGYRLPESLRFIAMGGAPVSRHLLEQAEQFRLPIFEGYGLSEASSVIAVNSPASHRLGSVGKVLDCHQLRIDEGGQIWVKDNLFDGYLGHNPAEPAQYYATGDIGALDDEGFLTITGRKKNIINTSYGRNISPEWIEKELEAIPMIAQAVVYGHARPYLVAIIVPLKQTSVSLKTLSEKMNDALKTLNTDLPDYARVLDFIIADEPFNQSNGQLTGTSRPRRNVIYEAYKNELDNCYVREAEFVNLSNTNGEYV